MIIYCPENVYKDGIKKGCYFFKNKNQIKKSTRTYLYWDFFSMCQLLLLVPVFWFLGPGFCASPSFCPWLGILRLVPVL